MYASASILSDRSLHYPLLWWGIAGFFLAILGCWATEYVQPEPFSFRHVGAETALLSLLGLFTFRRMLVLCRQMETAAAGERETNERLREQAAQLEANRRKLQELDHLKSHFVAMVSHELRTPLTSIIGFATTLRTLPLEEAQRLEYLGIIETEGKRLAAMVEEYLDVTKIESGTFELRVAPVDIPRLVQEVVDPVRQVSPVRIETLLDPAVPILPADGDRLKRVLRNLLDNAVRYTAAGSAVEVATEASADGLCFRVRDHGPGLTAHAQQRVFDRFFRGSDPITERSRGSGLGLAIARAIVEKHGGRIWVESTPGQGATFFFRIPLHSPAERVAAPANPPDTAPPATRVTR